MPPSTTPVAPHDVMQFSHTYVSHGVSNEWLLVAFACGVVLGAALMILARTRALVV